MSFMPSEGNEAAENCFRWSCMLIGWIAAVVLIVIGIHYGVTYGVTPQPIQVHQCVMHSVSSGGPVNYIATYTCDGLLFVSTRLTLGPGTQLPTPDANFLAIIGDGTYCLTSSGQVHGGYYTVVPTNFDALCYGGQNTFYGTLIPGIGLALLLTLCHVINVLNSRNNGMITVSESEM